MAIHSQEDDLIIKANTIIEALEKFKKDILEGCWSEEVDYVYLDTDLRKTADAFGVELSSQEDDLIIKADTIIVALEKFKKDLCEGHWTDDNYVSFDKDLDRTADAFGVELPF